MFKFILALVVAVLAGGSAGAEFTAGPTGPFVLVDATGKLMGGLASHAGLDSVAISTPEGNAYVGVVKDLYPVDGEQPGGLITGFKAGTIYFLTVDCSGQAYSRDFLYPSVDGGPLLVVGHDFIAYQVTGVLQENVPVASYLDTEGICQPVGGTNSVFPVTAVGDLSADFTAPFHIANMTTHYASLPLSLWWLLGGVLLGLGIKNAAKKS